MDIRLVITVGAVAWCDEIRRHKYCVRTFLKIRMQSITPLHNKCQTEPLPGVFCTGRIPPIEIATFRKMGLIFVFVYLWARACLEAFFPRNTQHSNQPNPNFKRPSHPKCQASPRIKEPEVKRGGRSASTKADRRDDEIPLGGIPSGTLHNPPRQHSAFQATLLQLARTNHHLPLSVTSASRHLVC